MGTSDARALPARDLGNPQLGYKPYTNSSGPHSIAGQNLLKKKIPKSSREL